MVFLVCNTFKIKHICMIIVSAIRSFQTAKSLLYFESLAIKPAFLKLSGTLTLEHAIRYSKKWEVISLCLNRTLRYNSTNQSPDITFCMSNIFDSIHT